MIGLADDGGALPLRFDYPYRRRRGLFGCSLPLVLSILCEPCVSARDDFLEISRRAAEAQRGGV